MDDSQGRLAAAVELVETARRSGATVRLLGGIAAALHSTNVTGGMPHREFGDIDSATRGRDVGSLTKALRSISYEGDSRFNALNAGHRLVFYGPAGKLDVFVNTFEMCHRLDLAPRLSLDSPTL